jgi:sister chromatid cohesion protein PDS5
MRVEELEIPFVRVLHLLAHHPDLDKLNDVAGEDSSEADGEEATPKQTKHETLLSLSKYIQFYVDQLVNAENISLIYHLALKVKTVRDAEGDEASEVQTLCPLYFPWR